jgi:DNA topoisomerase-1
MRTDSVNLSETALGAAANEINSAFGEKYYQVRKYKTKSAGAQEAHEAIRPTYFEVHTLNGDPSEKRLYELIWKRAIASQMAEAQFEKTTAKISISTRKEELIAQGEVLKFDGFLKVYMESSDEEDDTEITAEDNKQDAILPPLAKGQSLNLVELTATERYSRPPARYTEASLVKKLEELGIGRPSTYAPTISTVQNRGYVVKEDREGRTRNFEVLTLKSGTISGETRTENTGAENSKLFPTDIGAIVNDFLVEHFKGIVDFHFTAKVEKEFDDIAQGLTNWTAMLRNFYDPFHAEVQNTLDNAERANNGRELGTDPVSGKTISVRIGRFGPFVQIGDTEGEEKPRYASLRTGQMMESISLEDALELFKLPKTLGQFEDKDMVVAIGKFGPYVRHDGSFYSLPKEVDPHTIEEAKAIEIIQEKRQKDIDKLIRTFDENPDARIENGRWGPYIKFGKLNIKIPKDKTPESISYAEILVLAEAAEKEPKKGAAKRFAKKK